MLAEPEPPPRAAKPLPPRVAALVTQMNANPSAVTDEDLDQLQIRGYDTYSRIRLPDLLPLVERAIVEQARSSISRRSRITGRCPALAPARPEFGGFCLTPQKDKISFFRLSKTTVFESGLSCRGRFSVVPKSLLW